MLESEKTPLLPAALDGARTAPRAADAGRRALPPGAADVRGGRQSCRRAASVRGCGLDLGDLAPGQWRLLDEADRAALFAR